MLFNAAHKSKFWRAALSVHKLVLRETSSILRNILSIHKQQYAQAHALIARAYVNYARFSSNSQFIDEAKQLMEWVYQQRSSCFTHHCWGQPYDWQSWCKVPAYTPRTTVTSQVSKAYLDLYESTGYSEYLDHAVEGGRFLAEEMPRSFESSEELCFSYTPLDLLQAHNPNMMASGLFARLWHHTKNSSWYELCLSTARFTANRQNADGSWFYYNLPDNKPSKIDNYHTGYVLESFAEVKNVLEDEFPFEQAFHKGQEFYTRNMFENYLIPKMTPKTKYPIDIQSCAQSILTLISLSKHFDICHKMAYKVMDYTIDNFLSKDGNFYYRIYSYGKVDRNHYIRWGDAWMMLALSKILYLQEI